MKKLNMSIIIYKIKNTIYHNFKSIQLFHKINQIQNNKTQPIHNKTNHLKKM